MANDNVSEWTDVEVFEECVRLFGFDPNPRLDGGAPLLSRMVLDAMVERGYGYQIRRYTKHSDITEVGVLFRSGPGLWCCEHDSLDRAICEAAIQALRQEAANDGPHTAPPQKNAPSIESTDAP